jgi:hypothetical protein
MADYEFSSVNPGVGIYGSVARKLGLLSSVSCMARDAIRRGEDSTLAAHGPRSQRVTELIRTERRAGLVLRALLPDASHLVGAGATSLVFRRPFGVEKLDFRLLGASTTEVDDNVAAQASAFQAVSAQLGEFALPTEHRRGALRIRPLPREWPTLSATQPFVEHGVDVFTSGGATLLSQGGRALHQEVAVFAQIAQDMAAQELCPDLTQPGNLVLTEGHVRLIDVGALTRTDREMYIPYLGNTLGGITDLRLGQLAELAVSHGSTTIS